MDDDRFDGDTMLTETGLGIYQEVFAHFLNFLFTRLSLTL